MTAKEELRQMIESAILDALEEYKQAAQAACIQTVDKATALEREGCAQEAESQGAHEVAKRIRARSTSEPVRQFPIIEIPKDSDVLDIVIDSSQVKCKIWPGF